MRKKKKRRAGEGERERTYLHVAYKEIIKLAGNSGCLPLMTF